LKHVRADVNLQDHDGQMPLISASDTGHYNIVVELLQQDKVDVNLQDNVSRTALATANFKGHYVIVIQF
jgi:ankyrin repeat protein